MSAGSGRMRLGLVRYLGVSNWAAWQVATALGLAKRTGAARFASYQGYYSLVGREVLPMPEHHGPSLIAFSPLVGGYLTDKYRNGADEGRRKTIPFPPWTRRVRPRSSTRWSRSRRRTSLWKRSSSPAHDKTMAIVLGALSLLGSGIFGPGIANGIVAGGPQLGAGAAIGTGLTVGDVAAAAGGAGLLAAKGGAVALDAGGEAVPGSAMAASGPSAAGPVPPVSRPASAVSAAPQVLLSYCR